MVGAIVIEGSSGEVSLTVNVWPSCWRPAVVGWAMKAGSAWVLEELRCEARGAAIAAGSPMCRSMWLIRVWSTVVMIVAPPAAPRARTGRRCLSTMVGDMLERGRLPPAGRFGSGRPDEGGAKSKSVSSLLSRNPRPGTTMPLPPSSSIVLVYETTSPYWSATTKWLVSVSGYASAVAIGVGEPSGLKVMVQDLHGACGPEIEVRQDVERLADRGSAAGGRRHRVDLVAAVADVGRGAQRSAIARQVRERH